MTDFSNLLNLGPKSNAWLNAVGIKTIDDLEEIGVVEAYLRVKEQYPAASLNLLYALQGALLEIPWNKLPPEMKADLKQQVQR